MQDLRELKKQINSFIIETWHEKNTDKLRKAKEFAKKFATMLREREKSRIFDDEEKRKTGTINCQAFDTRQPSILINL